MMDDLVERLRLMNQPLDTGPGSMIHPLAAEAADEITRLRSLLQNGSPVVEGTIQHMAMQLAACQRDAARYRWLRTKMDGGDVAVVKLRNDPDAELDEEVDAAIDEAMKEAK